MIKILKLKVENFRGLKLLELDLAGKNSLISGPNGSGKSGVIDSIEFLFKGRVSRLEGEGTGSISMARHAPHVDSDAASAVVEAELALSGSAKPIRVRRTVKNSDQLEVLVGDEKQVRYAFRVAQAREFALSRREIVRFITAAPKDRREQIQDLLNLTGIELVRSNLKKVDNLFKKEFRDKSQAVVRKTNELASQLGLPKYTAASVLAEVNSMRATFGAQPITSLGPEAVKTGISHEASDLKAKTNWEQVEVDVRALRQAMSQQGTVLREQLLTEVQNQIEIVGDKASSARLATVLRLIGLATPLVEAESDCPLCDTHWDEGKLIEHLSHKRTSLEAIAGAINVFHAKIDDVKEVIGTLGLTVQRLAKVAESTKGEATSTAFKTWILDIGSITSDLEATKTNLRVDTVLQTAVTRLLPPTNASELLEGILSRAPDKKSALQHAQETWDILTRVDLLLTQLADVRSSEANALAASERATNIYDAFISARDGILQSLYDSIRDRFADLYRLVNDDNESEFTATLIPSEAGLDLTVEFFGRGQYPPHALHSEGHQDSMGLCLFLALAEKLNVDSIDVIVLDDVMMSVDSGHRAKVVDLLKTQFPNFQFVITTHETVWARQIRQYKLVDKKQHWEFSGWTVSDGPIYALDPEYFDKVSSLLSSNNVSEAASLLRRNLEQEFESVCSGLEGSVPYNSQHSWTLGPYKDGSISRMSSLLKKAATAAKSWGDTSSETYINSLSGRFDAAVTEVNKEAWILNPTVHFNTWATFDASELRRLATAYSSLLSCFKCDKCGGYHSVAREGNEVTALACDCSHLKLKSKQSS